MCGDRIRIFITKFQVRIRKGRLKVIQVDMMYKEGNVILNSPTKVTGKHSVSGLNLLHYMKIYCRNLHKPNNKKIMFSYTFQN